MFTGRIWARQESRKTVATGCWLTDIKPNARHLLRGEDLHQQGVSYQPYSQSFDFKG